MEAVRVEGLTIKYGKVVALEDISFTIDLGEMVAVIGPNGSGKSSLLKATAGLVEPDKGRVLVFNNPVREIRGRIAYLPQREEVYWDYPLTVWDVVAMGRIKAVGSLRFVGKNDPIVQQALEETGLSELKHRKISDLSGGQQQRVFLARAIAQGADLYLLDEPLTGVDAEAEEKLFDILNSLRRQGKTVVMSTHDLSSTLEEFDLVVVLRNKLIAYGPPADVLTTENLYRAYGSERVAMHFSDVERVAGWR